MDFQLLSLFDVSFVDWGVKIHGLNRRRWLAWIACMQEYAMHLYVVKVNHEIF